MTTTKRGQKTRGVPLVSSRPSQFGGNTRYPSPPGTTIPDVEYEANAGKCYWCGLPTEDMGRDCDHCGSDNPRGIRYHEQ